jgi:hypothetical protein
MLSRRHWLAAAAVTASGAEPVPALRGLSRTNLLEYRGADGKIRVARKRSEWEQRKREALAGMHEVTGPLPGVDKRCPLQVTVEDETDMGSYVRRAIVYSSEPGSRTPAYLCIPKTALAGRRAAGVLCLHPTDDKIGYKVVVGLGGRANRQYASELAERGFVTISPAYVQLAEYQPDIGALGYASGTMKAIWDNIRALDLLDELPQVRRGRYAAIGHSLGGHNAIYTAVHDERIRAIVSSCGFDSFLDYYGGNIKGWVQTRYMMRMARYLDRPQDVPFDFYELVAVLAPRQVFVNAPLRDGNFRHESVARIAKAAGAVFTLYGASGKLSVEHPDSDHDFPTPVRMAAYDCIERELR